MITRSVSEVRRNLGRLIDLARGGEDVVIIKDSRPVACLRPVDDSDLELALQISDRQARRLWEIAESAPGKSFRTAQAAVKYLERRAARKS